MVQYARPSGDQSIGSWTGDPTNTTGNRYQNIDETSASDTDFVRSENNPTGGSSAEFNLSSVTDPVSSTGHTVRYRYRKGESGGGKATGINIDVVLLVASTVIASNSHTGVSTTYADGTFTLTGGEADNITDYSDLRLRFTATDDGGGSRTSWGEISWAEFEVPSVASTRRVFTIS